jgi:hypothetical protein
MGWFSKQDEKKKELPVLPSLPRLPELPSLPELDEGKISQMDPEPIHHLPIFPSSSLGEKFSQNTIKEAVIGGKEDDRDSFEHEFAPRKKPAQTMQKSTGKQFADDEDTLRAKRNEPIFIRIDKFEESLKAFNKVKEQMTEIEEMVRQIRELKTEEEKELEAWENEIQAMKSKIEKVDRDLFSNIG